MRFDVKRLFILLTMLCVVLFETPILFAQSKFALVIGNGAYTSVTRLNNPVNDANAMATTLRNLGFQVELVTNATLQQMNEKVDRFRRNLSSSSGSYGFFFYAGHGVQSNGNNYLIPVNANISSESNLPYEALVVQRVLDNIWIIYKKRGIP
jgi:uncharacterized caspase-like protein